MALVIVRPNKHFTRCSNDFTCVFRRSTADTFRSVAERSQKEQEAGDGQTRRRSRLAKSRLSGGAAERRICWRSGVTGPQTQTISEHVRTRCHPSAVKAEAADVSVQVIIISGVTAATSGRTTNGSAVKHARIDPLRCRAHPRGPPLIHPGPNQLTVFSYSSNFAASLY